MLLHHAGCTLPDFSRKLFDSFMAPFPSGLEPPPNSARVSANERDHHSDETLVTLLEEHHRKHLATKSATGLDFTEVASKIRFPRRPP